MAAEKAYCRIPVKLIAKFADSFPYDVFLKLSDAKIVKISHQNEPIKDAIVRYHKEKGVQDIYVLKEDYDKILNTLKEQFKDKLFSPYVSENERIELLEKSYSMVKDSLTSVGISEATMEFAKKISQSCLRVVMESKNIFSLLQKFSNGCEEEFKKCIVVGYLSAGMVDHFDWRTDSMKEKCALSAILCDILLSNKEIKDMQGLSASRPLAGDAKNKIALHIKNVVNILKVEKWISKESLSMIEQHHEEQDGMGFPLGLGHTSISQLSAIFIVAMRFSDLLFLNNFSYKEKDNMLATMRVKYNLGVFKKATHSLSELLDKE